jgi:hypothetical protein
LVTVTCSGKISVTFQPLGVVVPLLVTDTSTWKEVPAVFEGFAVQLMLPLEDELLEEELELDELEELDELLLEDELEDEELELLELEELLEDELLLDDELEDEELELLLELDALPPSQAGI